MELIFKNISLFSSVKFYLCVVTECCFAAANEEVKSSTFDVRLTVHCSSMWNKKPTRCHLLFYLFLLYKLLNMFRVTLCPSSGADDLVVFLPRVV